MFFYCTCTYLHMLPDRLERSLSFVASLISKETTKSRKPVSSEQRHVVTLQYFTSGESQQSLNIGYCIGTVTMSKVLAETSDTIFRALKHPFLKFPNTQEEWLELLDFGDRWNSHIALGL